jgi:beta-N-acetylglucosaminidase
MHFDCFFAADADGDIPIGISHHHRAFDRRGQTTGARYVSSEKFHENDVTRFGQASYSDDCYIDYIDEEYFLINPMHPGIRLAVIVVD